MKGEKKKRKSQLSVTPVALNKIFHKKCSLKLAQLNVGQSDDPSKQIFPVLVTRWAAGPCPWGTQAGFGLQRRTEPACLLLQEFCPCSHCWNVCVRTELALLFSGGFLGPRFGRSDDVAQQDVSYSSKHAPQDFTPGSCLRVPETQLLLGGHPSSQTAQRGPRRVPGMPRELCLPTSALSIPTPRTGHTTNLGEEGEINHKL